MSLKKSVVCTEEMGEILFSFVFVMNEHRTDYSDCNEAKDVDGREK